MCWRKETMKAFNVFNDMANELINMGQSQVASKVFDRMVSDLEFEGAKEGLMAMAEEYEISQM